jgi:hypothetical protein
MALTENELKENLKNFTGTEAWYRHSIYRSFLYTEGVQFLAENAGSYWLLDQIFGSQCEVDVKSQKFQVWKLTAEENSGMFGRRTSTFSKLRR